MRGVLSSFCFGESSQLGEALTASAHEGHTLNRGHHERLAQLRRLTLSKVLIIGLPCVNRDNER